MRIVHLYPFEPLGRHGGTLRLRAAVDASAGAGEPEVHWFDRGSDAWQGPIDRAELRRLLEPQAARAGGTASVAPTPRVAPTERPPLKRRLFPSTLWESGRRARRAVDRHVEGMEIDPATIIFLHTTYLAGLLRTPVVAPARAGVVDVYDLVWCAHRNDARAAGPIAGPLRIAYSLAVRVREEPALRRADAVFVAGYEDHAALDARIPTARWVPTPTPIEAVEPLSSSDGALRIGVIGNFAHISTRRTAERLLRSELAADGEVRLLFAGLHAGETISPRRGVEVIGQVSRAEDFYSLIDCVVAPVELGSGIKCKLGEALLAGRPVVTTRLGAGGFPPSLRAHFTVCDPRQLGSEVVRRAVAQFDPIRARQEAERELGHDAVAAGYAEGLASLSSPPSGRRGSASPAPPPRP